MASTKNTNKAEKPQSNTPSFTPVDLSAVQRDELISGLQEVLKVFEELTAMVAAAQETEKQIADAEEKKESVGLELPTSFRVVLGVAAVVMFFMCVSESGFLPSLLVSLAFCAFLYFMVLKKLHIVVNDKKIKKAQNDFEKDHIAPLKSKLNSQKKEIEDFLITDRVQWVGRTITRPYLHPDIIQSVIDYVRSGRADTLKEALNLYEEEAHRNRMEAMQQQVVNTTAQTASAITKQSSLISDLQQDVRTTTKSVKAGNVINLLNYLK